MSVDQPSRVKIFLQSAEVRGEFLQQPQKVTARYPESVVFPTPGAFERERHHLPLRIARGIGRKELKDTAGGISRWHRSREGARFVGRDLHHDDVDVTGDQDSGTSDAVAQ